MSIEIGEVVLRNTVFDTVQSKVVKSPVTFTFARVYGLLRGSGLLLGKPFAVSKETHQSSSILQASTFHCRYGILLVADFILGAASVSEAIMRV